VDMEVIKTDWSLSSLGGALSGSSDRVWSIISVMGVGFPQNLNFSGVHFHSRVPHFQSMIGFSISSQGKPKIRCCFPSPEIKNRVFRVRAPKIMLSSVKCVIVPLLFCVLSTLKTIRGSSSFSNGSRCFQAKF